MAQWYKNNQRRFREEREILASACPLLRFVVAGPGFGINRVCALKVECAVVHGTYNLQIPDSHRHIEYGIVLVLPENYPKTPPQMFCNDAKLPIDNLDRHIMRDGRACLGVQGDIRRLWSSGSTIVDFLDNLVAPFLAWQAYYDVHQMPPPWGERSHYDIGILEFYAELLDRPVNDSVISFMSLMARKNRPKGHETCPCKSGKPLRHCHRALLYKARERIPWQDVAYDLEVIKQYSGTA